MTEEDCRVSTIRGTGYIDGCLAFEFRIPSALDSIPEGFFEIDQVFGY